MKIKALFILCIISFLTACDSSDSSTSTVPSKNEPPASIALPKAPLC